MSSSDDARNAQSAGAHIQAAKSAPHRKELELNQAENFARLIQNLNLRQSVMAQITAARR